MNGVFDQVNLQVQRARDNYATTLRSVDSELRKIVSQDPAQLAGARAIQASYTDGLEGCELAAAEQPAAAAAPTDSRKRRKSDAPKAAATKGKKAK